MNRTHVRASRFRCFRSARCCSRAARCRCRIFETRYIDLVRRCMRDGSGFGVVLIREGAEAGGAGGDVRRRHVCAHRGFLAAAGRPARHPRARASGASASSSGGARATGSTSPTSSGCRTSSRSRCPRSLRSSAPAHRRDPGAGRRALCLARAPPRRRRVGLGRLAEILPVPAVHKQHCLELDDPVERLRYLRPMFEIGY